MSTPRKKHNKKTNSGFVPLVQTWRKQYQVLAQYLRTEDPKDLKVYQECQKRWVKNAKKVFAGQNINTVLNGSTFANQKEKSYCVRDAINVCSDLGGTKAIRLWGVSVTGSVAHLLAVARSGNDLASCVSQTIDAPVAFTGAFPLHVASLLSPQAIGDISKFAATSLFDDNNAVISEQQNTLLKNLEPYLFQSHCDLEKIASASDTSMGTIILTFASVDAQEKSALYEGKINAKQSEAWSLGVANWKKENEIAQVFFTIPEQWSRCVVLGLKTYIDFIWGMNARIDNKPQKVLDVDRVFVEYLEKEIVLDAHTPEGFFATVRLPVETTMWPLLICLDDLQDRGIRLLDKN